MRWQRSCNELIVASRACAYDSDPKILLFASWTYAHGSGPVVVVMHAGRDPGHAFVAVALQIGGAFGHALVATAVHIFIAY